MHEWSFEHSVDAAVPPEVAWAFWSDVSNWAFDPSLEWVRLEGPFAAGTKGISKPREVEAVEWRIAEAGPRSATIEVPFPGVVWAHQWTFRANDKGGTRMTQRVLLTGPRIGEHIPIAENHFVPNIPEGMRKLAQVMESHRG